NDGPAIQQAILALPNGGKIELPARKVTLRHSVDPAFTLFVPYSGIHIQGQGREATLLDAGTATAIFVSPLLPLIAGDGNPKFPNSPALPASAPNAACFYPDGVVGGFFSHSEDCYDDWGDTPAPNKVRYFPKLTVECFWKPVAPNTTSLLLSSGGGLHSNN